MTIRTWNRNQIHPVTMWTTRRSPVEGDKDDARFVDYIPVVEWVEKDEFGRTHVVQIDVQRNDDLPYEREFEAMGLDTDVNVILDNEDGHPEGHLNDRDFRHRCVRYGNVLLKMFEKRACDYDSNIYAHADRLQTWLDCNYVDAYTIGGAVRRLRLSKSMARRMVFGYTQADGVRRRGLKGVGQKSGQHYAQRLEYIVDELPTLPEPGTNTPSTLEDHRQYYYDVACKLIDNGQMEANALIIMQYIEGSALRDSMLPTEEPDRGVVMYNGMIDVAHLDDNDAWWVVLHDQDIEAEEDMDFIVDALGDKNDMAIDDGIGTHPLSDGNDYIDLDYIERIKNADADELKRIQSDFYQYQDDWTGKVYPARNRWMNESQVRASWWHINDRKARLTKEAMQNVSKHTAEVIDLMRKLDFLPRIKALVWRYSKGQAFNYDGEKMTWPKPSKSDIWACWAVYREIEAAKR